MLIIPAIDLRGGHCVRLFRGDFAQETVYRDDPVAAALEFEQQGATMLHVVDLDGARTGVPANLEVVRRIVGALRIPIQFGGGIRTLDAARRALEAGARRVIVGTRLLGEPEFADALFAALGASAVAGIDARDGLVSVQGWEQTSQVRAVDLAISMERLGATRFVATDIATDGALAGPNLGFVGEIAAAVKGSVIASGGVSSIRVLQALAALGVSNLEGVIVGRALYEGRFTLIDAASAFKT